MIKSREKCPKPHNNKMKISWCKNFKFSLFPLIRQIKFPLGPRWDRRRGKGRKNGQKLTDNAKPISSSLSSNSLSWSDSNSFSSSVPLPSSDSFSPSISSLPWTARQWGTIFAVNRKQFFQSKTFRGQSISVGRNSNTAKNIQKFKMLRNHYMVKQ